MTAGVARMDNWGEGAAQAAGFAGLGTAIVVLVKFLVAWIGGRQDKRIEKLEKQVAMLGNRLNAVAFHGMALHARLKVVAPDSPELANWERLMRDAFPLDLNTPSEMLATAAKLRGSGE